MRTTIAKKLLTGLILCGGTSGLVYPQQNPKNTKIKK